MENNNFNIVVMNESEKYLGDERVKWIYENLYSEYREFEVKLENDKIIIYGNVMIPAVYEELPYKIDEVYGNVIVDNILGEYYSNGNIKTLKNFPTKIHGDFKCKLNKNLTNLKGAPTEVDGDFICAGCGLTDIKDMPKIIKGNFYIYGNKVEDLSPVLESSIRGVIDAQFNPCENTPLYRELYKKHKISIT